VNPIYALSVQFGDSTDSVDSNFAFGYNGNNTYLSNSGTFCLRLQEFVGYESRFFRIPLSRPHQIVRMPPTWPTAWRLSLLILRPRRSQRKASAIRCRAPRPPRTPFSTMVMQRQSSFRPRDIGMYPTLTLPLRLKLLLWVLTTACRLPTSRG